MRCVFGGTFNVLHQGHKSVISGALNFCSELIIGLTTDRFARLYGHKKLRSFEERKKDLEEYLKSLGIKYEIVPLDDLFGPALRDDVDVLIATEEVVMNALAVNRRRRAEGKKEIPIIVFPLVRKNGKISASEMLKRFFVFIRRNSKCLC